MPKLPTAGCAAKRLQAVQSAMSIWGSNLSCGSSGQSSTSGIVWMRHWNFPHLTTTSKLSISLRCASFSGPFPTMATLLTPGCLKATQRGLCSGSYTPRGWCTVALSRGSFPGGSCTRKWLIRNFCSCLHTCSITVEAARMCNLRWHV